MRKWVVLALCPCLAAAGVAVADGAAPRPKPATASPYVGGNPTIRLPAGRPGRIDVVATGPYDNTLPIVLRNNTKVTAIRIEVTGSAHSASGKLLAVGEDPGMNPNVVKPGEISFGVVYFDGATLPANARFRLTATWDPSSAKYENRRDLVVLSASGVSDRIVGFVRNRHPERVTLAEAEAACFSSAGKLLFTASDFLSQKRIRPGERVPFQISLFDPCPKFLIAVNGFED
jgi:hypothetical protein